jgi:PAS domain S-box-containing protein
MDNKKFAFSILKRISFIPLPLIVAIAVIIYIVDMRTIYEPPLLLPILNTIFTSGGGFTIALIAASAYVFGAKRQALFLGGGSLALGISALLAGWIFPNSLNVSVTIFSIGALLAAVLHILGPAQSTEKYSSRYSMKKFPRQSIAILFYSGIAVFFVILSVAAIRGLFSPFFVAGQGYTPIRWAIITAYIILFFTSVSLYARLYYSSKESFLYWYSLGLAIIAVGLTLAPLSTPGDPLNWLGRIAQYLGSIYFLIAAVSALKEARAKGMGLAQKLSNIWREPAISYSMLVGMAKDAIISIDDKGKVLVWSPAAERLFGYSQNEAIGSPFAGMVAADEQVDSLMIQLDHPNDIDDDLADRNLVELELRRKNGGTFTAELSVSVRDTPSGRLRMAIIRDITERKRAEEALQRSQAELSFVLELNDALRQLDDPIEIQATAARMLGERLQADRVFFNEIVVEDGIEISVIESDYHRPEVSSLTGRFPFKEFSHTDYADYRAGRTVCSPNVFTDEREPSQREAYRAVDIAAYIGVPLVKQGELVSVLGVLQRQPRNWTPEEIRLAEQTVDRTWQAVQRGRAEEALRESEQRFRLLVAGVKDYAIYMLDPDGYVVNWNEGAKNIKGYEAEEIVGKHFSLFYTREDIEAGKPELELEIALSEGRYEDEGLRVRKDGSIFSASVIISPIMDGDGNLIGFTKIVRDVTERKKMENALRESEQRYATTLASIGDAVISTDTEGRITFMNAEAEALTGWALAEASAKPVREVFNIINEHTRREADNPVTRVLREGMIIGLANHTILVRKDGTEVPIDDSGAPIRDGGGKTMGVVLVFRDITERKQAEKEIEHLASFPQLNPNPVIEIDANGTVTFSNAATAEVLKTLKMENDVRIFLPGDFEEIMKALEQKKEGQLFYRDVEIKDRIFAEYIHVIKKLSVVRIYMHEITERKRAEEALRKAHDELELRVQERTAELKEINKALLERETSYRELTESIDDLFYAMDRDLRYTYWNKASEALTGISAKDAIGKSLYELFPDIKGTKAEQFYIEALKTQQIQRFENEYQLGDKKLIFEINAYPTKDGLSVIAKDITERKMFETHLLQAQRMESIGILAGGIAHNLNNMLTPMTMSLHMLKQKFKDEQSQKLLTILEQNSQHSADLIKQVLSFSRGVEGERAPLQIMYLISEIDKIAKETFPRNIEIRTDIPKDLFTISGDATQLHQVIMNLCVNARDAMPDGGILSISAENFFIDENYARMHIENTEAKVGSYVTIAVSDTGIGIPPKILDRIFEPFFTTKEFGKGTGLGLSTALAIVKSHGGFINVYSEVGKGTTFRVYLPAIQTEMQNVEEQLELPVGNGEFVLVAEDEDSVREVTVSTLKEYGYNVLAANDGVDAVALYAQNMDEINVVLMDMMMPVMDGEASIRAIRKINPEVKVIVVSGLAEKDKLAKIESTRAQAILPKPYTAEKLLKAMHEVLSAK